MKWAANGIGFVVVNEDLFSKKVLPSYFKHSNYSSFVRQVFLLSFSSTCTTSIRYVKITLKATFIMNASIGKMNKNLQKLNVSLRKRKERMRKVMKKFLVQIKFESHVRYYRIKKKNRVRYMNNLREDRVLRRRSNHKRSPITFFLRNIMKINSSKLEILRYSGLRSNLMIRSQ